MNKVLFKTFLLALSAAALLVGCRADTKAPQTEPPYETPPATAIADDATPVAVSEPPVVTPHPLTPDGILADGSRNYPHGYTIMSFDFLEGFVDERELRVNECYLAPSYEPPREALVLSATVLWLYNNIETDAIELANILIPHMPSLETLILEGEIGVDSVLDLAPSLISVIVRAENASVAMFGVNTQLQIFSICIDGSEERKIVDISGIGEFKHLTGFSVWGNSEVTDISELARCSELDGFLINTTTIKSVGALYGLKKLEDITLYGIGFEDLPLETWRRFYYGYAGPGMTAPHKRDRPTIYFGYYYPSWY